MTLIFLKGPSTSGIFRKSVSEKKIQMIQKKLDYCSNFNYLEEIDVLLASVLIKRFLRALPDCLLCCEFYEDWCALNNIKKRKYKIARAKRLFERLPVPNQILFNQLLLVMFYISRRSFQNKMNAHNLAVCISPSILWPALDSTNSSSIETSKQLPEIIEFLIKNYNDLFAINIHELFPNIESILKQQAGMKRWGNLENLNFTDNMILSRKDSKINLNLLDPNFDQHKRTISLGNKAHMHINTKIKRAKTFKIRRSSFSKFYTKQYKIKPVCKPFSKIEEERILLWNEKNINL